MMQVVFYVFAAIAVASAAMCILQRSPVSALIWLVQVMLSLGAIFVLLSAQFIGLIQILVYAGAIMVLFLFIIMLLNLGQVTGPDSRGPSALAATIVVVGLLAVELWAGLAAYTPARVTAEVTRAAGFMTARASLSGGAEAERLAAAHGVVGGIAAPLFGTYLIPFEITSLLLLVAIVGAVVLAKRRA
ncbi:MAG TPA: NADH-quinone oxidoreductase subunit J [Gemmatimonadales bacterium]|nr:NADH-quinone oxidoreductase subunit J [Gemmatimonadales bacterium]